jgi:hypothetical protein
MRLWLIAALALVVAVPMVVVIAIGLVTIEAHSGYFGPAWAPDGKTVYCIERVTRGLTWGAGWEFFTPPANAWVFSDAVRLCAIEVSSGRKRVLESIPGGPVAGRVTSNYRSRIFGIADCRIDATGDSVEYVVAMALPRVPTSDQWHVKGTWPRRSSEAPRWRNDWASSGVSEPVLVGDRELLVTDGAEAYPAAILVVTADTSYSVLIRNADFARRYPDGVPASWIAERSRRDQIERVRRFQATHDELVRTFRNEGMGEGDAILEAYDRMEDMGLLPKDPEVVARKVDAAPAGATVFAIPSSYFEVGLFRDIAAAIAVPGDSVETGTGDYLKYYDDDVGPRLREYRDTHSTFFVRVDGRLYRLDAIDYK